LIRKNIPILILHTRARARAHTHTQGEKKNIRAPKYIQNYKFYRKLFQINAVEFKKIYLLILSI